MKRKSSYIFLIFALVFGLILLISIAQILAKKNINGLKDSNDDARITFNVNNLLQNIINLSFDLESKILKVANKASFSNTLADSLTMLGYNTTILDNINISKESSTHVSRLKKLVDKQVSVSNRLLETIKKGDASNINSLDDSIRSMHFYESVLQTADSIRNSLENDLTQTLHKNTSQSTKLSDSNKILAFIAIFAVLLLATIILNRHLKQVELIEALEKAKNEAQQSSQIKNQFMANMSHEIRTPLNAISGYSKILLQTDITEKQQHYAHIIREASDNLIYIVNDILDISKIEAGKLQVQQKAFNLEKIVQTVQYMFLNSISEKQLLFSQTIAPNLPIHLKGDPDRLLQILVNLISNAIKFTRAGEVSLSVSQHRETEARVWLKFVIEDTGIGIPAGQTEKIFNRFEQLTPPEDFVTKGTGLGLNIVKNLVDLMQGDITVTSEPGKGSKFSVHIPFHKIDNSYDNAEEELLLVKNSDLYKGNSFLIVEDNKVNQLLLKHLLERNGATVDIANNGAEAIPLINSNFYNLIFLDLQMPVMNGYQLIDKLRNEMNTSIPVIAMTAFATEGEKEKCKEAGMTDYISKPLQFAELATMLKKYTVKPAGEDKAENPQIQSGFLMQLAGNDKHIANEILKEVKKEIPIVRSILDKNIAENDIDNLSKTLHHMVSTFSPLGIETPVMKQIQHLQILVQTDQKNGINKEIKNLLTKMDVLDKNLTESFV